jgi:antitoxin HicB
MKYHFKLHKEGKGYWAECIELKGCVTQADSLIELKDNLKDVLDLYLDEPEDSKVLFPLPKKRVKGQNIVQVEVNPQIALAFLLRRERLKKKWTQVVVAKLLGMPLYSYQRLENSKTANPEWKTLTKLLQIFPDLDIREAT